MKSLLRVVEQRCVIDDDTDCWLWRGALRKRRYPTLYWDGRNQYVRMLLLADTARPRSDYRTGSTCGRNLCCNPAHVTWVKFAPNTSPTYRLRMANILARRPGYLSLEIARRIRSEGPATTDEQQAVATQLGVSLRAIKNALTYRTWKEPGLGGLA